MVRRWIPAATIALAALMMWPAAAASDGEGAIKSLVAYPERGRYLPSVIRLGSDDRVVVSFDTMGPDARRLRYRIIHCDASWRPDAQQPYELGRLINEERIDDFAYSQGTLTQYVNYRMEFPSEGLVPPVSGNWLIAIYDEEDPSATLAEVPVMVTEDAVGVGASVTSRTDGDYNGSQQQLEVTVNTAGAEIRDPWNDLRVAVMQNGRPDTRRLLSRALRVNGSTSTFAHAPELLFKAGNEYRRFETVSTSRYLPMGVEAVGFDRATDIYHFKLYDDSPRSDAPYAYDQTQQGAMTIAADDVNDPETEAEYVDVHFSLDMAEQPGADIVIEGELTGRDVSADSPGVMTFNRQTNRYEAVLSLKQGSYNYQYLVVPHGQPYGLTAPTEGDRYQTRNRYDIAVYYREPGGRYDRLLGFASVYSGI